MVGDFSMELDRLRDDVIADDFPTMAKARARMQPAPILFPGVRPRIELTPKVKEDEGRVYLRRVPASSFELYELQQTARGLYLRAHSGDYTTWHDKQPILDPGRRGQAKSAWAIHQPLPQDFGGRALCTPSFPSGSQHNSSLGRSLVH